MLEKAELGRKLSKKDYKVLLPELRAQLLEIQVTLQSSPFSVILILEGVDNVSQGEVANKLNEWMDTRGLEFNAFGPKTEEELQRPRFWRYWRSLPARGRIGIFSGSWYTGTLLEQTLEKKSPAKLIHHLHRIAFFESMLARDNVIILKFWLHKSREQQQRYIESLDAAADKRWTVTDLDYSLLKAHNKMLKAAELTIRNTDSAEAPWLIVEASDIRYCNVTVAQTILHTLQKRLNHPGNSAESGGSQAGASIVSDRSILSTLDMSAALSKSDYIEKLEHYCHKLTELSWQAHHKKRSLVIVFEGWDAAGKGGAIRRIIRAVDARILRVIQVAAPTDEERAHHYLWRFWRHIPQAGHAIIYDRSWYGRVLVERVEGFAREDEWRQAYQEINQFEEQLTDHGIILAKFWLHITPEKQLERFREREAIPYKQHKLTQEDWRNRDKWADYEQAVQDMVVRTTAPDAPWELIAADDKGYTRVEVLKRLCQRIEAALADHK
jgi:polyphosphate:AMP phosphotransferase